MNQRLSPDQRRRNVTRATSPDAMRGLAAGAIAGLVASATMHMFQSITAPLLPPSEEQPATEKAADRLTRSATGQPLPEAARPAAGNAVHYGFGIALGAGYGLAAEQMPGVTSGFGTAFGSGTSLLIDEALVPALGLAPPATAVVPARHVYGAAAHLVYGMTAELVRRALRGRSHAA